MKVIQAPSLKCDVIQKKIPLSSINTCMEIQISVWF